MEETVLESQRQNMEKQRSVSGGSRNASLESNLLAANTASLPAVTSPTKPPRPRLLKISSPPSPPPCLKIPLYKPQATTTNTTTSPLRSHNKPLLTSSQKSENNNNNTAQHSSASPLSSKHNSMSVLTRSQNSSRRDSGASGYTALRQAAPGLARTKSKQHPALPPPDFRTTRLLEDYDVARSVLEKGKFANVRLCTPLNPSSSLPKSLCVKQVRKRRGGKDLTEDMHHEVSILQLAHRQQAKHIIQIIDAYEEQREFSLVLEFASGGELYHHLPDMKHYNPETHTLDAYKRIMRQITDAIAWLHQHSIVHLDIKSNNIFLDCDDFTCCNALVGDFGLSRVLKDGKKLQVMVGTPAYCAPEVIRFDPVTLDADVFSLGVVFYEIVTGDNPFLAFGYENETYNNIQMVTEKYDYAVFSDQPGAQHLLENMLKKFPRQRYSIHQVQNDSWLQDDRTASPANETPKRQSAKPTTPPAHDSTASSSTLSPSTLASSSAATASTATYAGASFCSESPPGTRSKKSSPVVVAVAASKPTVITSNNNSFSSATSSTSSTHSMDSDNSDKENKFKLSYGGGNGELVASPMAVEESLFRVRDIDCVSTPNSAKPNACPPSERAILTPTRRRRSTLGLNVSFPDLNQSTSSILSLTLKSPSSSALPKSRRESLVSSVKRPADENLSMPASKHTEF